jgi:hypothetical protein
VRWCIAASFRPRPFPCAASFHSNRAHCFQHKIIPEKEKTALELDAEALDEVLAVAAGQLKLAESGKVSESSTLSELDLLVDEVADDDEEMVRHLRRRFDLVLCVAF